MLIATTLLHSAWKPVQKTVQRAAHVVTPSLMVNMLQNLPSPTCAQLCNGLTVVTEPREGVRHACVGLFLDAGSRYEVQFENGMAHFFEHIAFKGTRARNCQMIENQMSCTGARFKSFTTREMVAYYAECHCDDVPLVIDLLADSIFNNCLSYCEIERQKQVLYQEMKDKDVDHNLTMFDYLHAAAYQGTSLAQSVIGPTSNLENFCDMTLARFLYKIFNPSRTVLAAVGAVDPDQILSLAQLYLGALEPSKCLDYTYRFSAGDFRFRDDALPLCNAAIAFEAPSLSDFDSYTMDIAGMFIGGWDRSQVCGDYHACHLAKAGYFADLADSYQSFYFKYKDTGLFGIQFLAKRPIIDEFMYNVQNELMKLCVCITDNEVERAKNELKTRLLRSVESLRGMCVDLARHTLYCGQRHSLLDRLREIDSIDANHVRTVCNNIMYDKCPAVAAVGPCESFPEYPRIRAGQYWLRT